jgi:integrase
VPDKPRRIITAAQFDRLYQALPDANAQLLVEIDIESGMRWGEL